MWRMHNAVNMRLAKHNSTDKYRIVSNSRCDFDHPDNFLSELPANFETCKQRLPIPKNNVAPINGKSTIGRV